MNRPRDCVWCRGDLGTRTQQQMKQTVLYCILLYCTVLYCTVLYCTECTVLYCTASNAQYCILTRHEDEAAAADETDQGAGGEEVQTLRHGPAPVLRHTLGAFVDRYLLDMI